MDWFLEPTNWGGIGFGVALTIGFLWASGRQGSEGDSGDGRGDEPGTEP